MRLLTGIKHRVYRLLGIVSPSGAYPPPRRAVRRAERLETERAYRIELWDESDTKIPSYSSGMTVTKLNPCGIPVGPECGGDPFDSRPCVPACSPHEATPVLGDHEAVNGREKGVQGC